MLRSKQILQKHALNCYFEPVRLSRWKVISISCLFETTSSFCPTSSPNSLFCLVCVLCVVFPFFFFIVARLLTVSLPHFYFNVIHSLLSRDLADFFCMFSLFVAPVFTSIGSSGESIGRFAQVCHVRESIVVFLDVGVIDCFRMGDFSVSHISMIYCVR